MTDSIASQKEIIGWIRDLAGSHPVFFPERHGKNSYRFQTVTHTSDIQFDHYRPSIVPPVKCIVPARESLLHFEKKADGRVLLDAPVDSSFRILAGVRPCDLKGLFLMDLFFADGIADPYYLTRRKNTFVIAYACPAACDEYAFCAAVDSLDHRNGADVFLTPIKGGDLLVTAITDKGAGLLAGVQLEACLDGPAKRIGAIAARPDAFGRSFQVNPTNLPAVIKKNWESPVWEKHVLDCFSCGTCNLVCPTCYCFDIHDDLNLDASSGTRHRTWDACMLPHFSAVAGGHNFRADPAGRQRHRIKRKFEYLPEKYGHGMVCVGCGRCGRQCTSGIDIFDIVTDLCAIGDQP